MKIDTLDVLEAAGTKWTFLPFRPGLVGGHCISVDPYYLTHKSEQLGYYPQVVLAGRRINDGMGRWVVEQLVMELALRGLVIAGAKILVLGFTFKENCSDLRNTRVLDVVATLQEYGMMPEIVDPWVDSEEAHTVYNLTVVKTIPTQCRYRAVIAAVAHTQFLEISEDRWNDFLEVDGVLLDLKDVIPDPDHLPLILQGKLFTNFVQTFLNSTTRQSKQPQSIRLLLLGIWSHIEHRHRIQFGLLLLVMLISAVAELVSLGAVLPFLVVINDPERLLQQSLVQELASRVGITSGQDLLMPATLAFAIASVLAALIRMTNLWLNAQLAASVGTDLSCEAYRRTLYQPYVVHVKRNSAEVITSTINHIGETVHALNSFLTLITSSFVAAALFIGLLLIDAPLALTAAALFGSIYGVLMINTRRELRRNSYKIAESSTQQLKSLQEGLGAIRDVLLDGSQNIYIDIYKRADRPKRRLQAKNYFLIASPRYVLEAFSMVAIATLGGVMVFMQGDPLCDSLLGTMALGAQRLLPTLQQIYGCLSIWVVLVPG